MVYIGIDLGTTYSCVSVVENDRPVSINSDDGKYTIPSVVAYCGDEILVGYIALQSNAQIENKLYDSKRLIGWHVLTDIPIWEDQKLWTFHVDTKERTAGYVLNKDTKHEMFIRPEQVSSEILKKLKYFAEKYKGEMVTGAVVTIPAFFHDNQIAATKRAVELAGLELVQFIEEPTAAAIAYDHKHFGVVGNANLLVFDFGGGTLDISIVQKYDNTFEIKTVTGDSHLGGQDFDIRIMKYVIDEFSKTSNIDLYQRPRLLGRLRDESRKAKEALSQCDLFNIHLDINDDDYISVSLSRAIFNNMCEDLFSKAMQLVDRAIATSPLHGSKLDYVILVGGSARIPKIQELLAVKFGNEKLKCDLDPNSAVAFGAAIMANAIERGRLIMVTKSFSEEKNPVRRAESIHNIHIEYEKVTTKSKDKDIQADLDSASKELSKTATDEHQDNHCVVRGNNANNMTRDSQTNEKEKRQGTRRNRSLTGTFVSRMVERFDSKTEQDWEHTNNLSKRQVMPNIRPIHSAEPQHEPSINSYVVRRPSVLYTKMQIDRDSILIPTPQRIRPRISDVFDTPLTDLPSTSTNPILTPLVPDSSVHLDTPETDLELSPLALSENSERTGQDFNTNPDGTSSRDQYDDYDAQSLNSSLESRIEDDYSLQEPDSNDQRAQPDNYHDDVSYGNDEIPEQISQCGTSRDAISHQHEYFSSYSRWTRIPGLKPFIRISLKDAIIGVNNYIIEESSLDANCNFLVFLPFPGTFDPQRRLAKFSTNCYGMTKIRVIIDASEDYDYKYVCTIEALGIGRDDIGYSKSWNLRQFLAFYEWQKAFIQIELDIIT